MKIEKTIRGFKLATFKDHNDVPCSIQKSSLAFEDAIWFGCDDADPKYLKPGQGWTKCEMPIDYIANTRMHLTREQVEKLLPILQHFVDKGELPDV